MSKTECAHMLNIVLTPTPHPFILKELRFLKNHRGRGAQDFFVKMEGGNPYREVVYQTGCKHCLSLVTYVF